MDEFSKVNLVCTDNDHNIKKALFDLGNFEVLTTGVEPAVGAEAENSLANTLELRFLKTFEFKDEEGVFYDVLKKVNSEKFKKFLFHKLLFCTGPEAFRKVRSICCSQTGASQALPALCRQKCPDEVRNEPFFHRLKIVFLM